MVVCGDGCQTRDFVSGYDVAEAFVCCVQTEKADGEIINIGSGKPTKIQDLAKTVVELTNSSSKIKNKQEREGEINIATPISLR